MLLNNLEFIMNIDDVVKRFGNLNRACLALEIVPQNMTRWKNQGYIPMIQQYRIAMLTEGELMPDEVDPRNLRKKVNE